jgi:mono/diheme cytochrome c family protein
MKKSEVCLAILIFALAPATRLFAADAPAGKAIYDKQCIGCHGADGKGNPAMIKVMGEKGLNITGKDTMKKSDEDRMKN